ncbi:2-amino-4-hydroxy-6-hydroxymethyldihydropteridinepyrophosphokinase [Actinobaculum suis]|uniref:Bifunctional folate synthesis protein n=1 Tax=Actinobaculum suis TaxID=1657 RepID=A0A1B9BD10_9ACTO|nr:2-amino-4-hydroxy-6-hydroxymethyldihydropteridine diphosphokinase [Actinobaculum suis]OCA94579.1 2-amino-4-hydroxy-6-hydroxymethyldihydropteridine pyrophosphokinase [Actinobaculum suis]OCA94990.1 2-amino-4-hydroxy-6-hydroxymethyldihydropteridine pyrophosphokinase [Actinobaculum suis]VDG77132.1 2-amino-4-hydroxy-6-hydroxymethyldihydropteridinepyrophosphokinase [Actinobaculum suis]
METTRYGYVFDTVAIHGVEAIGSHGVFDFERERRVPFRADIEVLVDASQAAARDQVADTVSYADLAADAEAILAGPPVNLIETLAARIAEAALARGGLAAQVTVHKPEAPVAQKFTDVAVTVRRDGPLLARGTIQEVVLGLGANLGEPEAALDWAIGEIKKLPVHISAVSDYYRTKPVLEPGQATQPDYTNAVLVLTTALAPLELLAALQEIEVRGGRVRHTHWGPRTLDIDIEKFGDIKSSYWRLQLPHPRAATRGFVLEPWAEIQPEAELDGIPVRELAAALARNTSETSPAGSASKTAPAGNASETAPAGNASETAPAGNPRPGGAAPRSTAPRGSSTRLGGEA